MSEILVDPITMFNLNKKQQEEDKNKVIQRELNDSKDYKAWVKNNHRVEAFNKRFTLLEKSNHIIAEVFLTYDGTRGSILDDTVTGLTPLQDGTLQLFPIVKDLATGTIYSVSSLYALHAKNEEAIFNWDAVRAGRPSLEETHPRPPEYIWGFDQYFSGERFDLDPLSKKRTPQRYYTFAIPLHNLRAIIK